MSERTPEITREEIDEHLTASFWCIWPGCDQRKIRGSMLCHLHVAESAELVFNTRNLPKVTVDARDVERGTFESWLLNRTTTAPPIAPRDPQSGHIYILRTDDLIKIGFTTRPYDRLRQYPPSAQLLCLFPGTRSLEREIHGRFRFALRKGREWFRPADEILTYAADMVALHGVPDKVFTDRHQDPGPRQKVGTRRDRGTKKTAA